jgi:HD-GYP domain-containing protein (c-di-GMP phosphodiesterase class II)
MGFIDWFFFWRKKMPAAVDARWSVPERVYTPVGMLSLGMYVIELDRPWLETDFLFQGFEITTTEELQALKAICNHVYIDTTILRKRRPITLNKAEPEPKSQSSYPSPPKIIGSFEEEMLRAKETYHATGRFVAELMDRISHGDSVDTKMAKQAVAECVNTILHSPDAALWLTQLKNKDEYTAQHSLNVCVLSIVLGRHIALSEANLNNVGLCGLMHDVGKLRVPLQILNKPGKLDEEEMRIMQMHPGLGSELLQSSHGMYVGAINSAHSHHERIDGKGYPREIGGHNLSLYTKIVTIADMYDAMTSDRVYQKGRTHLEATKIMFDLTGRHVDETLVIKFVESLGVYPPGCFVSMTNRAIGVVIESNETHRLRPKVLLILDEFKTPISERIIDLALLEEDIFGNPYTIRGIVKASDYRIDSSKYYQEGVLQKGFILAKR